MPDLVGEYAGETVNLATVPFTLEITTHTSLAVRTFAGTLAYGDPGDFPAFSVLGSIGAVAVGEPNEFPVQLVATAAGFFFKAEGVLTVNAAVAFTGQFMRVGIGNPEQFEGAVLDRGAITYGSPDD